MITLGLQKKETLPFLFKHLNLNAFSCESDVKGVVDTSLQALFPQWSISFMNEQRDKIV